MLLNAQVDSSLVFLSLFPKLIYLLSLSPAFSLSLSLSRFLSLTLSLSLPFSRLMEFQIVYEVYRKTESMDHQ